MKTTAVLLALVACASCASATRLFGSREDFRVAAPGRALQEYAGGESHGSWSSPSCLPGPDLLASTSACIGSIEGSAGGPQNIAACSSAQQLGLFSRFAGYGAYGMALPQSYGAYGLRRLSSLGARDL